MFYIDFSGNFAIIVLKFEFLFNNCIPVRITERNVGEKNRFQFCKQKKVVLKVLECNWVLKHYIVYCW